MEEGKFFVVGGFELSPDDVLTLRCVLDQYIYEQKKYRGDAMWGSHPLEPIAARLERFGSSFYDGDTLLIKKSC